MNLIPFQLKQFQQKYKESNINNTRSSSSSLKSNSPIDSNFNIKEQQESIAFEKTDITSSTSNIIIQPIKEYRYNCPQHEISTLFNNQTIKNNKYDSFFDDVSQTLSENKTLVTNVEEKNEADKITVECDNSNYINGDNKRRDMRELKFVESQEEIVSSNHELENLLSFERSSNVELQTKLMESVCYLFSSVYKVMVFIFLVYYLQIFLFTAA